jgi:hypothetical protein
MQVGQATRRDCVLAETFLRLDHLEDALHKVKHEELINGVLMRLDHMQLELEHAREHAEDAVDAKQAQQELKEQARALLRARCLHARAALAARAPAHTYSQAQVRARAPHWSRALALRMRCDACAVGMLARLSGAVTQIQAKRWVALTTMQCVQDARYVDSKLMQVVDLADQSLRGLDEKIHSLQRNITELQAPGAEQVRALCRLLTRTQTSLLRCTLSVPALGCGVACSIVTFMELKVSRLGTRVRKGKLLCMRCSARANPCTCIARLLTSGHTAVQQQQLTTQQLNARIRSLQYRQRTLEPRKQALHELLTKLEDHRMHNEVVPPEEYEARTHNWHCY